MYVAPPKRVILERDVEDSPVVSTLRKRLPEARFQVVDLVTAKSEHDPEVLEVIRFRGRFMKSCPGTRHYLCCGYRILHFGVQCSLGCTYCILQVYLNQSNLRIFGNTKDLFQELDAELEAHPGRLFRVGTGEFTDSLLLDPWTQFSRELVPVFAQRNNAVLELKTKTNHVENLFDLEHGGHTIVAWSLNAQEIVTKEESKAASLEERLKAAAICAEKGYYLAFHFDPMVEYPDWRRGYGSALECLFDCVKPRSIVWISLGAFRFMPDLKHAIHTVHPHSVMPYGEFIRGLDGKMRYFRDVRVELYSFMVERIRHVDPNLCVYLCMEGGDIWRQAFGYTPPDKGGLPAMLDRAVRERMGVVGEKG